MQQEIMGSHVSPDLWISTEKKTRSAELKHTFCEVEFRRKNIFSRNRSKHWISRSPLHKTKDEFRPGNGLDTRSAEIFFQQKSGTQFVQWSSAENQITLKSAKNCLQSIRGHRISIFRRFFSADLMPHNRPQKKKTQSPQIFVWQKNLRLQCQVLYRGPYPTYWGGTCDREELAWVTLWETRVDLVMGNVTTHYHGLAPCFLKAPWKEGFI